MAISGRIRQLREERRWTQIEFGQKIDVQQKQVFSYESGVNTPPTDVLIKFAETCYVALDFLAFEDKDQPAKLSIQDREFVLRFDLRTNEDPRSIDARPPPPVALLLPDGRDRHYLSQP